MKTKSSNNYLSYLKVNNATLTPAFDKNTTVYSLTTKEDVVQKQLLVDVTKE